MLSLLTSLSTYEKGSARRKETGERGEEGTDEPSEPGSDMRKEPGAVHKGTKGNGTAPLLTRVSLTSVHPLPSLVVLHLVALRLLLTVTS